MNEKTTEIKERKEDIKVTSELITLHDLGLIEKMDIKDLNMIQYWKSIVDTEWYKIYDEYVDLGIFYTDKLRYSIRFDQNVGGWIASTKEGDLISQPRLNDLFFCIGVVDRCIKKKIDLRGKVYVGVIDAVYNSIIDIFEETAIKHGEGKITDNITIKKAYEKYSKYLDHNYNHYENLLRDSILCNTCRITVALIEKQCAGNIIPAYINKYLMDCDDYMDSIKE